MATIMPSTDKFSHLSPETLAILDQYPATKEAIFSVIDLPPLAANILIESLEFFVNGFCVVAYIDDEKTIDVEAPENVVLDTIEIAINGQLALAKVGNEIVINRIDDIARASLDLRNKLSQFF